MGGRGSTSACAGWGTILIVSICVVAFLAPAADAFYAGPFSSCSPENSHHCYAISSWDMVDGESSGVNGATLEILDNGSTVPGPLENFASNEMWTSFRDIPNSWLESGELTGSAGGYLSSSSTKPQAFYAFQNQVGSSFRFFTAPANVPAGSWFWVENLYVGNGIWDSYIEGAGPFQMTANLPGGADTPQDGLEMTNASVSNSGETRSPVWEAPSGHWQYGWYDPYSTAFRAASGWENFNNWAGYNTAPTCAQPTGTAGAIKFTSWPYPNPDPQSCFYGDHQITENIVRAPSAVQPLEEAAEAPLTVPGQQPPVSASAWQGVPAQTGPMLSTAALKSRVLQIAAADGEAAPTDIQAVALQRGSAIDAANPETSLPNTTGTQPWASTLRTWYSQQAYLVTLHGKFTADVPAPPGSVGPTGTVLTLVLDAQTGAVTMIGLDKTAPAANLATLGAVKEL